MKAPGARGRGGCAGLGEGEGVLASLQTRCVCGACRAMHLGAPAGPSEGATTQITGGGGGSFRVQVCYRRAGLTE